MAHIGIAKGIPFYGFHVGYCYFLKIYLFNPGHIIRLADLLRQGAVLMKPIQPYESHMQFIPQWMCDYNLYGCAYLDCVKVSFRSPVPEYADLKDKAHLWHDRSITPSMISNDAAFPRQSHCPVEVDICVQNIANRLEIKERQLHHGFIERQSPIPNDQKLVHSMAGLWKDETRRRKARMDLQDSDNSPFPPEVLVSVSADPRSTSPGGWIHEEEYKDMIELLVENEVSTDGLSTADVSFDAFSSHDRDDHYIRTTFETVTELYPENMDESDILQQIQTDLDEHALSLHTQEIEVDESRIFDLREEEEHYDCQSVSDLEVEESEEQEASVDTGAHTQEPLSFDHLENQRPESSMTAQIVNHYQSTEHKLNSGTPQSSAELEACGIRKATDYDHIEEDAFEIEAEFRSKIFSAIARDQKISAIPTQDEFPRKRRKLLNGKTAQEAGATTEPQSPQNRQSDMCDEYNEVQKRNNNTLDMQADKNANAHLSTATSRSQPSTKDSKLPFTLVKDPLDPQTIQRLSQTSNSGKQRSTQTKEKHVSFNIPEDSKVSSDAGSHKKSSPGSSARTFNPNKVSRRMIKVAVPLPTIFPRMKGKSSISYAKRPPRASKLMQSFSKNKLPSMVFQDAYYSDENDVPERIREYAGKGFRLQSNTVPYLPSFDPKQLYASFRNDHTEDLGPRDNTSYEKAQQICTLRTWEIRDSPPTYKEVQSWLTSTSGKYNNNQIAGDHYDTVESQIDIATPKNRHGFKYSQKQTGTSVRHETQYMSLMSLEIHVNTRERRLPDPEKDEVACIVWCVQSDSDGHGVTKSSKSRRLGILALSESGGLAHKIAQFTGVEVDEEATELDLINRLIDVVQEYDPDILTGFEVHNSSWGYLIERARCQYEFDLCSEFSRTKTDSHGRIGKNLDPWGFNQTSTIRITGRHMINIWRAMRGELNLLQYTMENIVFHTLHRRVPHYPFEALTKWYQSQKPRELARAIDYYTARASLDLEILEHNELVPRTSEQARLLGVDFFSVFSRGSQFKVESLMFRIAKPENFLLISPSRKQVGQQNALECLPLVMEPQSAFYPSPLLVLDFQSLYPSVMIAYNYCYSTFLGRVVSWRGQNKMGFTDYARETGLLKLLKDHVNVAPNGMIYVKPEIRKSLLAKMLGEILETRVMVKSGMKLDKEDKTLQRLLNNRQLALKLIANVTYGYTSASFSGRMPCSEIADSIVQTGRETLEKAIALIHSVERWGAEVVYGDTDSLFVYLKGRARDEAFDIGEEIAKAVTKMNPRPVKLKFEKVYHPCVLLAKKRYVGFKYESKTQKVPDFDAKGIETVRRDGTPAEQKMEERALKILFRTADLSQVKAYFKRQCTKIMKGKVSIQDFCFAREVKLGTYSDRGPPPPGALISTRRMLEDHRAEPQYGERVPYVVIAGAPGARLIDRCVAPEVLLRNDQHELDADYYILKNLIPPLERIFNLVGANVKQWYEEMPKYHKIRRVESISAAIGRDIALTTKTLESFLKASTCLVCKQTLEDECPVCADCMDQPEKALHVLYQRVRADEDRATKVHKVCRSCAGLPFGDEVNCDSKDCAVFYTRIRHMAILSSNLSIVEPVMRTLKSEDEVNSGLSW